MKYMIRRFFSFMVLLCILQTPAYSQLSGGQIKRSNSIPQNNQTSKNRVNTTNRLYPQRDEVFLSNVNLLPKEKFEIKDLSINYIILPAPDYNGHVLKRNTTRKQISLKQVSCRQNNIIDDDKWLFENELQTFRTQIRTPLNKLDIRYRLVRGNYHILLLGVNYGTITKVIVTDSNEELLYVAYDFENFRYSPKTDRLDVCADQIVLDVAIEGNIMYVAHSGNTYSSIYGNQTGYITAIDMFSNEILWTTLPKTNNCSMIEIVDNSIITGYGFTGEPDNLYVVDKYSGERIQKISLKKAASYIIVKGKYVYIRTYSFDYIFAIQ